MTLSIEESKTDYATPLQDFAVLGDGRSVAVVGRDGSIDWWCVPNLDSPPLFDKILNGVDGGCFALTPIEPYAVQRRYRDNSNVLETTFTTATGVARLVESMNSGLAGRLPWNELARRVEGLSGSMSFRLTLILGARFGEAEPLLERGPPGWVFSAGPLLGVLLAPQDLAVLEASAQTLLATITVHAGNRSVLALVVGENEPLAVPRVTDIDERIDVSDEAWRRWAESLRFEGDYDGAVRRSALALKLLLFSPSGAIAAAATTSLPERIGGSKNWDYRYAWIRDAAFTMDAFLNLGLTQECKAAFTWLSHQVAKSGAKVCYTLWGEKVPAVDKLALPGYRNSRPVVVGNAAGSQHQHGIYADLLEVAVLFVRAGHLIDRATADTLAGVADECASRWKKKDSGIWELSDLQHYTLSKISAWQALDRAAHLAHQGVLPAKHRDHWLAQRDAIATWVDENCWSEARQAYTFYAGTDRLDASLARAALVDFGPPGRLHATCDTLRRELGCGPLMYRYTGSDKEEGAFLACSFWLVEAYAHLGRQADAVALMHDLLERVEGGVGILSEMVNPTTGDYLGNLPQGLSHLGLINAACALARHAQADAEAEHAGERP